MAEMHGDNIHNATAASHYVRVNDISIHYLALGESGNPLVVFLHGFPEHSGSWSEFLAAFSSTHYAVAPDLRGYGKSSKPVGVKSYRPSAIAADVVSLVDALSAQRSVVLVGHDWGAAIAYMVALRFPHRVEKLIVINGVHPLVYQQQLLTNSAQVESASYIHELRAPDAAARLAADGFARLFASMSSAVDNRWLTPQRRQSFVEAWSQPGAIDAMCNWYRAAPLVVPQTIAEVDLANVTMPDKETMRVNVPHLLIWGTQDSFLNYQNRVDLESHCANLTVLEIDDADHWVNHQKTDEVIGAIRQFIS